VIEFILNNQKVTTSKPAGLSLLDFIRKEYHLFGTKIGCREGDCGACTVLEGALKDGKVRYKTIVSCLTPLANVHGKHIVTVEGLNMEELSPVQQAMADNAATQCGFCTPGFVVSLTGLLLSDEQKDPLQAISGNICRCTGYKSIEKAAVETGRLKQSIPDGREIETMLEKEWLPDYFADIPELLKEIPPGTNVQDNSVKIAGGTDLMVQQHDIIRHSDAYPLLNMLPSDITVSGGKVRIGAGINTNDFLHNSLIGKYFPSLPEQAPLIASEQIRNMGTLAGNMVNASPIGDMNILLLALEATLLLENTSGQQRELPLKNFFLDYKKLDLEKDELIKYIIIEPQKEGALFNFEKVSKRTYLDIASVNSAISVQVDGNIIRQISLSLGGIAAIPKYMVATCAFLKDKELSAETLGEAFDILQEEITPIDDIRGSAAYKRLLARQLFLQHFMALFPELPEEDFYRLMTTKSPAV
jgi:xanthine dehydrogenase small subunit